MSKFDILDGANTWALALVLLNGHDQRRIFPPLFELKDITTKMKGKAALDISYCCRSNADRYDMFEIAGRLWWDPKPNGDFYHSVNEAQDFTAVFNVKSRKGQLILGAKIDPGKVLLVLPANADPEKSFARRPDRFDLVNSLFGSPCPNHRGQVEPRRTILEFTLPSKVAAGTRPLYGDVTVIQRIYEPGTDGRLLAFAGNVIYQGKPEGSFEAQADVWHNYMFFVPH